jgi:hypothetical protein
MTACQCVMQSYTTTWNIRPKVRMYEPKPCERKATETVGPLQFCAVHARVARDGLMPESGVMDDPSTVADRRKHPHLRFMWANTCTAK